MIGGCGWKIGGCGWYDTSTIVDCCVLVHCDGSAGTIAPVSARTPTHVDDCVRVPHVAAALLLKVLTQIRADCPSTRPELMVLK